MVVLHIYLFTNNNNKVYLIKHQKIKTALAPCYMVGRRALSERIFGDLILIKPNQNNIKNNTSTRNVSEHWLNLNCDDRKITERERERWVLSGVIGDGWRWLKMIENDEKDENEMMSACRSHDATQSFPDSSSSSSSSSIVKYHYLHLVVISNKLIMDHH